MKYSIHSSRGFTIVEVLVAMLLLGLVLTGGMQLYFCSNQMLKLALHKKMATELLSNKLEDMRKLGYNNLPDCGGNYPCNDITSDVKVGDIYTQLESEINLSGIYKEVHVKVTWYGQQLDQNRSLSATTLIAP